MEKEIPFYTVRRNGRGADHRGYATRNTISVRIMRSE